MVAPRDKNEPHLYTDYTATTLFNIAMTPIATPVSICKDMVHIEHRLRGIPHSIYDTPLAFSYPYRYKSD